MLGMRCGICYAGGRRKGKIFSFMVFYMGEAFRIMVLPEIIIFPP